jgi:hypothetical protein
MSLGVPLFIRMPLWCDTNLYDVAANAVATGGVHYRDVFDTNLHGFVWLLVLIRSVVGPGSESLQLVDLGIVAGIVALLVRFSGFGGATSAGRAWLVAGVAAFYLFLPESCHTQRDVWMMLPVSAAVLLRFRRVCSGATARQVFASGACEGAFWGAAFWIKPHVFPVAVAAWLITAIPFARRSRPHLIADLCGAVVGGVLVGGLGVAWLVLTGTWDPFMDVFTNWNTAYLKGVYWQLPRRLREELSILPPWSLGAVVAVPLALRTVLVEAVRSRKVVSEPESLARSLLAATYLAWLATTLFLQKQFLYVHVPEIVLMLAVFATNRWPGAFVLLAVQAVTGLGLLALGGFEGPPSWHSRTVKENAAYRHVVAFHPSFDLARDRWWPQCFRGGSPEMRNGLAFYTDAYPGTDWVELEPVAAYLEGKVRDGTLICWHDSPCALYRRLDVKPSFRFMHLTTVMDLGEPQYQRIRDELIRAAVPGTYVVSDLRRVLASDADPSPGPDSLPVGLQASQRTQFPFTQPAVFRSPGGRYLVHRVVNLPIGDCRLPRSPGAD